MTFTIRTWASPNAPKTAISCQRSRKRIPTPFVKGTVYDAAVYKTDYVDTRGISDLYGGSQYTYFHNTIGANLDWLLARDKNMAFSASRSDNLPKDDAFADQELTAYTESVGYEQRLNEFVSAGVNASYAQNMYPAATNRPDSSSQSYSAHTSARLTRNSVGSAGLGYAWGSTSGGGEDESGGSSDGTMTASLSLQTQLSKSLAHVISYGRSQRAGFNSPFEIFSSYSYALAWKGELTSAGLFSGLSTVDPQSLTVSSYSDWQSGVNVSYPVYVNLPFVIGEEFGQYVRLSLSSTYDLRDNGDPPSGEAAEPEWSDNYTTWISRIGSSFPFIWADILFAAYVEHVERGSDNTQLAYRRDILAITLTYTHQF